MATPNLAFHTLLLGIPFSCVPLMGVLLVPKVGRAGQTDDLAISAEIEAGANGPWVLW